MWRQKIEILLVEDNPEDAAEFTRLVEGNYNVTTATNGAEALDRLFRRGKFKALPFPDLVVIDLNIPLLNGHEVLNVIRANSETRHLPVIVYSVSQNPADIRKAYQLGACAYMLKPSDLEETESRLNAFANFWLHNVEYPEAIRTGLSPAPPQVRYGS